MVIFELIAKKKPYGKIGRFYASHPTTFGKKLLYALMFINWIPIVIMLSLLLLAGILCNFGDYYTFLYTMMGICGSYVVFVSIIGFINTIRDFKSGW